VCGVFNNVISSAIKYTLVIAAVDCRQQQQRIRAVAAAVVVVIVVKEITPNKQTNKQTFFSASLDIIDLLCNENANLLLLLLLFRCSVAVEKCL
jgi:hypothetical protein